jgi:diguanylate cyclase (GGDEF)-like protein
MDLLAATPTRKGRHGINASFRLVLVLCLFGLWQGLAYAGMPLRGSWREVRSGDTPAAVLADFRTGSLQPFDPYQLNRFPRDLLGSWVVLQMQPPWVEEERVFTIYPPLLGTITLYDQHGPVQALALDDFSAPMHGHGRLAVRYDSNIPESAPILLKFEPSSSVAAPVSFHMEAMADYLKHDSFWLVLASASFSIMLAMALMALCFALMLRDSTFGYYAGYIFCYALIQAIQTGFLFHPLDLEWAAGNAQLLGSMAVGASVAFAALFMVRFCELRRFVPLLRIPVQALAIAMPLIVLMRSSHVDLLEQAAQTLLNPLLLLGALLLLAAAFGSAVRGSRSAWFFLAGWTPLLVLTAMSSAQISGALPGLDWLNDASLVAGAFESMVLSVGLADRALMLRRDRDLVRALANNDSLTNVMNRRAWNEAATFMMENTLGQPLALLFLDLDRFKMLNDEHGHAAGDRALVAVARALQAELRPTDLLGRYGGEEFIAMLGGVELEQAMQVATRLCRRVHRLEIPIQGDITLSISIGIAMRMHDDNLDSLVERADQAMYAAKMSGRNQARSYEPHHARATPKRNRPRLLQND